MTNQMFYIGCLLCSIICASDSNITNGTHLNRNKRQTSGCVLPPHPHNGQWSLLGGTRSPDDTVPLNSVLEFKCNSGYKLLSKNKHAICANGWSPERLPECEVLCPPRFSTSTTFLQCFDRVGEEISCNEATHGTYMKFNCSAFFEPIPGHRKITYCVDGVWSSIIPECRPICGLKSDAMPLLYGGTALTKLLYPWVVALYKREHGEYLNICGGTIIHRKVVLTVAHCVADEFGVGYPVANYAVAAAKLYNKYMDSREQGVQYLKVIQFMVHPQYKDSSRRFLADIALVITRLPFKLNMVVRPVCINDLNTVYLQPGAIGEIAGWGVTESGLPSENLRSLEIPHKYNEDCVKELPPHWAEKYNIIDKMCAGSPEKNISVCKGDSGSGLSFKNIEDNRYYVHGIVSLAPTEKTGDTCNIYTNALYTKVSFYYEFIDLVITRLNWCKLPNYPKNGKWHVQRVPNKVPGEIVSPFDILKISCDKGYKLTVINSTVDCETLLLHPPTCVNLTEPIATPLVNYSAEPCGIKVDGSKFTSYGVDGEQVKHIDSPWVVMLYDGRELLGHGNILTRKLVITAARVLTVWNVWTVVDPENVTVVTGKYTKYSRDPRDPEARYYDAEKIIVFEGFKGAKDGLYGDMGFIIVKKPIQYGNWSHPVCIQGVNEIIIRAGHILEITGWVSSNNTYVDTPRSDLVIIKKLSQCKQESPDLATYLSPESICGGPVDNSTCIRHYGSGLVYKNPEDNRYYLTAMMGFGVNLCVGRNNFYLSMKYHYNYIMEQVRKYN